MVKIKKLKDTVKTYGKKKVKERKDQRPILINSVTNIFHITNNYFINKSSSGDEFDKLFKQTPCHVTGNNPSTSRAVPNERFFQQQERATFYHSDATSEMSSSVHLFKDTFKDSSSFSFSHIPTPPTYQKKNNKLVRVISTQEVKQTQAFKLNRKRGKCSKVKRLISSPRIKNSLSAASSTPTHSHLVAHGGGLWGVNVSPILPPEVTSTPTQHHKLLAIEGNMDTPARKKCDLSALVAVLGRLEIAPSQSDTEKKTTSVSWHHKKECGSIRENKTEHRPMKSERYDSPVMGGLQYSPKDNTSRSNLKRIECADNSNEKQNEGGSKDDISSSKSDEVLDERVNRPMKNHQNDSSLTNESSSNSMKNVDESPVTSESDNNSIKDNIGESPVTSESDNNSMKENIGERPVTSELSNNSMKENICESPVTNESSNNSMKENIGENSVTNESGNNLMKENIGKSAVTNESSNNSMKENICESPVTYEGGNNSMKENFSKNSVTNESGNNSMKKNIGESPVTNKNGNNSMKENICESPIKNESGNNSMKENIGESPVTNESGNNSIKVDIVESQSNGNNSLGKSNRVESIDKNEPRDNLIEKYFFLDKKVRDGRWAERGEEGSSIIKHNRLTLQPGKPWKRSLLQLKQEENRNSSISSIFLNKRRKTVGPVILAKLIKGSRNDSALDFSKAVNESLEETLPILRMDSGNLNTITKRRGFNFNQPLDILEEEEHHDESFNLLPRDNAKSEYRASMDMFKEEEEFCNDDFLCSGVDNLISAYLDHPSCHAYQEEEASNFLTGNVQECPIEDVKLGALVHCQQEHPLPFTEVFPDVILNDCKKIGEGVFGEVFMLRRSEYEMTVVKIIPVEGDQLVNNEPQKCLDEVLSEIIISEELSSLRNKLDNCTSGFCELKSKFCLQGAYPLKLVELWKKFATEEKSENDCPDMFGCDQLYIALELDHAGQPVENFKFDTAEQALSVFLQTTFSLGIAELSLEFEHRDLHIGNVLIKNTSEVYVPFIHKGSAFQLPTYGVKATIIDFTLSRMSFEGDVLFCDLAKDPELFTAEGDYQFEIYRLMRDDLQNNWKTHAPITNVRWLDYLVDKLISKKTYKKKKSTIHKKCMNTLNKLKKIVLDFQSSSDLLEYLLESYQDTVDIIKVS